MTTQEFYPAHGSLRTKAHTIDQTPVMRFTSVLPKLLKPSSSFVILCTLLFVSACGSNPFLEQAASSPAFESRENNTSHPALSAKDSGAIAETAIEERGIEERAIQEKKSQQAGSHGTNEDPVKSTDIDKTAGVETPQKRVREGVIIEVLANDGTTSSSPALEAGLPEEVQAGELSATDIAFIDPQLSSGEIATDIPAVPILSPLPLPPTDIWQRIREGFAFDVTYPTDNSAVNRLVAHYIKRIKQSPRLQATVTRNAEPYLFYVVEELEKHDIPLEIALLPIVESLYDPFAYSPGRASGLWQFIPSTGKRFGLSQNWWQDERRDTVSATGAAIQYLTYLHRRFGNDWLLALASYNAGQGNISKAIRRNKKLGKNTDYGSLKLPKETRHYVPKLLAWREIIKDPGSHGIELKPIANQAFFEFVDVGSQIDLAEAADLAEVDIDTLYQLNPAYNRWATDPETPHHLLVPYGKKTLLEERLIDIPVNQRLTWKRYTIKRGDSLIKIAKQFHTTPRLIAEVNQLKSNRIRAGAGLLIPSASRSGEYYTKSASQRLAKRQQRSPSRKKTSLKHTVASGETLWDIGKKYGVSSASIARWNGMAKGDVLRINQKLVIWQNTDNKQYARVRNNEKRKLFYKVRSGDSLARIADKFNLRIADIKKWNSSARQKYLQPGQLLTLYVALTDR